MIPTRNNDDDEPDVIDLTVSNGHPESGYFSIRPPSPFADYPVQSLPGHTSMNDTAESVLCSPSHAKHAWRRTLNKFFKRDKSKEHKKAVSTTTHGLNQRYDFGTREVTRSHSLISRGTSTNKRVHWIDDDDMILNASHRFLEDLKSFVHIVIEDTRVDEDYLKQCQKALNELDGLMDCQHIKVAFIHLIQSAHQFEKNRLSEQQAHIEKLISQTVVFSSA